MWKRNGELPNVCLIQNKHRMHSEKFSVRGDEYWTYVYKR